MSLLSDPSICGIDVENEFLDRSLQQPCLSGLPNPATHSSLSVEMLPISDAIAPEKRFEDSHSELTAVSCAIILGSVPLTRLPSSWLQCAVSK